MVKRILLYAALALIACTAVFAQAAPAPAAGDFYGAMLRRGIVSFDAGRDVDAVRQLRIAAFGFVDSLDLYQTAETYLALAYERSGNTDRAREAARKVVAAQRKIPRYAVLPLPAAVRASFDALAIKLLTTAEVAALRTAASATAGTPQTAGSAPATPVQKPPVLADASTAPATQPVTAPPVTAPASPAPGSASPPVTRPEPATTKPVAPPAEKPVVSTPVAQPPASSNPPGTTSSNQAPPPATTPSTPPPTEARETPREQPKTVTTEVPFRPAPSTEPPPAAAQQAPPVATPQPAPVAKPPAVAAPATARPQLTESETAKRLVAAERALNAARLTEARTIYRDLLAVGSLARPTLLRVAEGLYRARDFAPALQAFRRLGTLSRGEEPYRYYIAVALYETGDYARAKDELRAVLPFIEVTPDVARYQAKIEGAVR